MPNDPFSDPALSSDDLQDLLSLLNNAGHGELIQAVLEYPGAFTRTGRLNRSALCRHLGRSAKRLAESLDNCKQLLEAIKD